MTYDLLLAGDFDRAALAGALADVAGVPAEAVDIADRDAEDRTWDAPVLCTYDAVPGSLPWALDIYVAPGAAREPDVAAAAGLIAAYLGVPVLWAAEEAVPSAYWLVAPDGTRTRARVYEDGDDQAYQIDAVEVGFAGLPGVRVEAMPEVIREHLLPTPVADEVVPADVVLPPGSADLVGRVKNLLAFWEQLTGRMAAGWPPDGWYPADFYREDLAARDELEEARLLLPESVAGRFRWGIGRVDERFKELTREADVSGNDHWWRRRVPKSAPRDAP